MNKLKVGDTVVIHKPVNVGEFPVGTRWMDRYDGSVQTIKYLEEIDRTSLFTVDGFNFNTEWTTLKPKQYNPVKTISRNKYYRCRRECNTHSVQFNSDKGIIFMDESPCGKYYYWGDYDCNNNVIYRRGEKSWVEDNYESVKDRKLVSFKAPVENVYSSKFKTPVIVSLVIPNNMSANEAMDYICEYADYLDKEKKSIDVIEALDDTKRITSEGNLEERVKDGDSDESASIEQLKNEITSFHFGDQVFWAEDNTQLWDSGELARDENFVKVETFDEDMEKTIEALTKNSTDKNEWTDKHYDFNYTLTEKDIEKGVIKIDPYFVNRMWRINSWDDTGAAFHSLKNYARICNGKNPLERDLKSLYEQIKRLCELHKVKL